MNDGAEAKDEKIRYTDYDGAGRVIRIARVVEGAAPAAIAPPPGGKCPDCGGSGKIALLVSARPCRRCGGTGRERSGLRIAEPPIITYLYDDAQRLEAYRERIYYDGERLVKRERMEVQEEQGP